ncbi:MAG: ABC transporter ATP-binding protein [Alphaproteobacteria bacterium]
MSERSIISLSYVSKYFGPVHAVDDLSLEIQRGEFFSLLGPSGCGKTTLLRMLAGFEWPTKGEIFIDGQPMSAVPPHQRPVNMVFQNYAIFPHLNVRQNIAYGMRKARLARAELDQKIDQVLEMIKLSGYGSRAADELSGGQRQRVALARALIKQPKVLLLDEPLGALDKKLREEMQLELRALQQTVGITFVFVTHDQEEALTMSDRVAVMSMGKVLQIDSPSRLYEAPVNQEVAGFIGNMNFFNGLVRAVNDDRATIDVGPLGEIHALANGPHVSVGAAVTVAIRPEKITFHSASPNTEANVVQGILDKTAYFGDRSHLYIRIEGLEKPIAVVAHNLARTLEGSDDSNRPVWLSWLAEAVVLLPSE